MTDESDTATLPGDGVPAPTTSEGILAGGAELGRYVVVEHVASGGAGSVYMAYDSVLDRRIALKLLDGGGADTQRTLSERPGWERLVREARMLAKLNHPNVVAAYDAGEVDERPYLAMEFVEGTDLARWIDQHRRGDRPSRGWRAALDLVRQAGRGLAAAHGSSIVHGDFKPANVLVDGQGVAKVSDFGIARVGRRDGPAHEITAEKTDAGGETTQRERARIVGTPAYMAPEQFLGQNADALTDVYSFCATMFEAMYGRRPHRATSVAQLALLKSDGAPARPESTDVPGWVYDLAARGLEPDPTARPASVDVVLAELDERLRPRRWPWALGAVAVGGALAAGGWATLSKPHPFCADADSKLAGTWDDDRRAAVRDAILGTGYAAAQETWTRVSARLDAHADGWTEHFGRACEGAAGIRADELSARAFVCLRERRTELRALVDVLATIDGESVLRATRAMTHLRPVAPCSDPNVLASARDSTVDPQAAEAVRELLTQAAAKHDLGEYDASLDLAEQARERAEALDDLELRTRALERVGMGQTGVGKYLEGKETLQEAYYLAVEHGDDALMGGVATELADAMQQLQDAEAGLHWIRIAKIATKKAEAPMGVVLVREAELVSDAGRPEEAVALLGEALLTLDQEGAGGDVIAATHNDLGNALRTLARYDEALEQFREARRVDLEALGALHPNTSLNLIGIGGVYIETGRFEEAAEVLSQAVDELTTALGPDHPQVGVALANLAIAYSERGDFESSVETFRRAADLEAKASGERSLAVARTRMNIAITYMRWSHHEQALAELEDVQSIFAASMPADHPDQLYIWSNLGNVNAHLEDFPRALEALARARDLAKNAYGEDHPHYLTAWARHGEVLVDAGRMAEAIPILEAAIPRVAELEGQGGRTALAKFALARGLHGTGRDPARVRALAEEARDFMKEASPKDAALMSAWLESL